MDLITDKDLEVDDNGLWVVKRNVCGEELKFSGDDKELLKSVANEHFKTIISNHNNKD